MMLWFDTVFCGPPVRSLVCLPSRCDFCRQVLGESVPEEVEVTKLSFCIQILHPSSLPWCGSPRHWPLLLRMLNHGGLRLQVCCAVLLLPPFLQSLRVPLSWVLGQDLRWDGRITSHWLFPCTLMGNTGLLGKDSL